MLDAEKPMVDEPKAQHSCSRCGATFPNRWGLSSHGNRCPRRASQEPPRRNRRRAGKREAKQGDNGKTTAKPDRRAPGGPPCPLCCQALPAEVGILVQQLQGEGLDETKALKAAVICWAGLRIP